MSNLAKVDVREGLGRLSSLWPHHRVTDATVDEYYNILVSRGVTTDEFRQAVSEYAGSDANYFPRPYALIHLAKQPTPGRVQQLAAVTACPSCRREWFYAGYLRSDGVVVPRLRCHCDRLYTSERWQCADARAWREDSPIILGG